MFEDRLNYTDRTSAENGRLRYAVGNSQVRYLAETYGDSTIARILAHREKALFGARPLPRLHERVPGRRGEAVRRVRRGVAEARERVLQHAGRADGAAGLARHGPRSRSPGQVVYDVAFSPDTTRIAAVVLTSVNRPVTRLYVVNNTGADSTAPPRPPRARRGVGRGPRRVEPGRPPRRPTRAAGAGATARS